MNRISTLLFATSCLLAGTVSAQGVKATGGNGHTRMTVVTDVQSLQPGATFTAGVVLTMDPGWHTYWKNPGDAGIATEITWTLPKGFAAGQILWPVPEKKIDPGDVLFFGYSGEVMLLVPITIAYDVPPSGNVTLEVQGSWLECEATCVPGEGKSSISLPVKTEQPHPAHAARFAATRARLPGTLTPDAGISIHHELRGATVTLQVKTEAGARWSASGIPDFFPEPPKGTTVGRNHITATPSEATITLNYSIIDSLSPPVALQGVLVCRLEGREPQAIAIEIPLVSGGQDRQPGGPPGLLDRTFTPLSSTSEQQSLIWYLFFALVGGVLLNIMPCVLPVIALKVFGLVKMAGDQPKRIKRLGWMFSLGILASFLVLALLVIILKVAGQEVGWGFQFQEPLFVMAMGAIVFAFGLSLFGVFEIQLPPAAVAGVSGAIAKQESKGVGYVSSFLEGVFATILATPCTAPFLGTALGFAFAQPWWMILLIFAVVAFGMALPYLLLTSRPAWMRFLPKPGEWMVTVKQGMGFLMMGTLIWLLYVFGKQLGMEAVIWAAGFLLTVGVAAWLIGRFATLSATRRVYRTAWAAAVVVVIAGYWFFLAPVVEAQRVLTGTRGLGEVEATTNGVTWEPFSVRTVEAHLAQNKTVFIDFTAEWCLTCKVNEKTVLADREVVDRLTAGDIVTVKADWTNRNPEITKLLAKFGRSGVPLYVVFPAGRPDQPIVLPEVITKGIVLDALKNVRGMKL